MEKILIIIPRSPKDGSANGAIETLYQLALGLQEIGLSVAAVCSPSSESERQTAINWAARYSHVPTTVLPASEAAQLPALGGPSCRPPAFALYNWLKEQEADLGTVIYPELGGAVFYSLTAKSLGLAHNRLPFIGYLCGPTAWAEENRFKLPSDLESVDIDFMERESVRLADALVSTGPSLLRWMRQHKWKVSHEVEYLPPLFASTEQSPLAGRKHSAKHSVSEIVYIGSLDRNDGLRLFCDAVDFIANTENNQVTQIAFLILDQSENRAKGQDFLRARTEAWKVKVSIYQDITLDDVFQYADASATRLAVLPSPIVNSPALLLGLIQRKIPFLASEAGVSQYLIDEDGHSRTLFAGSPSALRVQITSALTVSMPYARLSFDPSRSSTRWIEILRDVRSEKETIAEERETLFVSVVLVHLDRPMLLAQAIASLRAQTYRNFEVILVDDGSQSQDARDYLMSLEPSFTADQWRIVYQENRYLGAARNRGIREARGDYILFMDDDNLAKPNELETFARAAQYSGVDVLTSVFDIFSGESPPEHSTRRALPLGAALGSGLFENAYGDANAFWRRKTLLDLDCYTEDYGIGHEDWELFAYAALSGCSLACVPEPLFWYRVNPSGMLQKGNFQDNIARNIRAYRKYDPSGLGSASALALRLYSEAAPMRQSNQEFERELKELQRERHEFQQLNESLRAALAEREARLAEQEICVAEILQSRSWRIGQRIVNLVRLLIPKHMLTGRGGRRAPGT